MSPRPSAAIQADRPTALTPAPAASPSTSEEAKVSQAVTAILTAWRDGAVTSYSDFQYKTELHIIAPSEWHIRDILVNDNGADAHVFVKSITKVGAPMQGNWHFHFAKDGEQYILYSLADEK